MDVVGTRRDAKILMFIYWIDMRYAAIFLFLTPFACAEDDKPDSTVDQLDTATEPDCITSVFYLDNDSDGFGDLNNWVEACAQPEGTVLDISDCDDTDATINPDGVEVCNDKDDDCNLTDDGVGNAWYADSDGDGFGNANSRQRPFSESGH